MIGVQIDLGQHTAAGAVQVLVIGADQLIFGDLDVVSAVQEGVQIVLPDGGLAQQFIDGLAGHSDGVGAVGNQQFLLGIGADLGAVVDPGAGRTAEVIAVVVPQLQLAVVQLLTQFDDVALNLVQTGADNLVLANGAGERLAGGGNHVVHLAAGCHDVAVGVGDADGVVIGLHNGSLQGVQGQLSHVVAGQRLVGLGGNAVEQTDLAGLADGGQLKALFVVALILEVAKGAHHHGRGLDCGNRVGRAVLAVAVAGDNAVGIAGGYVGSSPAGHVPEAGISALVIVVVQVQQKGHDHGHLGAVDLVVRAEIAIVVADHDLDSLENLDGLGVVIAVNVGVARSAGADHHHAQEHDGSQSQAESPLQVSHSDFLLIKFFGLRGAVFGKTEKRKQLW